MSTRETQHQPTCLGTVDKGCGSCPTSQIRSQRRISFEGGTCETFFSANAGAQSPRTQKAGEEGDRSRLALLAVAAFVAPAVVGVLVVQSAESRVGSATAAIAGMAAAGLAAVASSTIIHLLTVRKATRGTDQ